MSNADITTDTLVLADSEAERFLPRRIIINTVVLALAMFAFISLTNVPHLAWYLAVPAYTLSGTLALVLFYRNIAWLNAEADALIGDFNLGLSDEL